MTILLCELSRRQFVSAAAWGLAASLLYRSGIAASEDAIVEIDSGKLRGTRANGVVNFKGIPYAADTGGANRFMAPRPVPKWTGTRDAFEFGDRCPQSVETMSQVPVFAWYGQTSGFSENCCVLNVYTPDLNPKARLPVMFYLHGGGFSGGGGGGAGLDGSNLAKFGDVVVVTVNHRLNAFGFTNLGYLDRQFADSANAGQLDLIAALTWVKHNIHSFGGDPNCVTLFGQSGGGSKITTLMVMPEAKELFHRAINMSGVSAFSMKPAEATEPLTDELLKELGIEKSNVRKLQEVPADKLVAALRAAVTAAHVDDSRPVIDGRHILSGPLTPQGLAVNESVPLMMGVAETEATLFLRSDMRNFSVNAGQVKARIKAQFGLDEPRAQALMEAYTKDNPNRSAVDILESIATDTTFRVPMLRGADAKVNAGKAPVYLYNFVWRVPVQGGIWRTPHASDIPFAFGNIENARMMTGPGPGPEEVARNVMSAFVAFARTGNPNNPRMPEWKPYNTTTRPSMSIDEKCTLVNDYRGADRLAIANLPQQEATQIQRGPLYHYSD
jgi:para-nitrobenzyl esterase